MAFPDHRGQALEGSMDDANDSIENLEKEVRDLKNRMLEMDSAREDLRKLELQMEWIDLHLLTTEESDEMGVYIDI